MIRQLLTESLVLAALGGAIGVGLAYAAVPLLNRLVPAVVPMASAPTVDSRVLSFAIALTVITGVGFGMAPLVRIGDVRRRRRARGRDDDCGFAHAGAARASRRPNHCAES